MCVVGVGGRGGQYMDVVVGVRVQDENSDNYTCDYYTSIMSVVQFLLQRISLGKHFLFNNASGMNLICVVLLTLKL